MGKDGTQFAQSDVAVLIRSMNLGDACLLEARSFAPAERRKTLFRTSGLKEDLRDAHILFSDDILILIHWSK